MPENERLKKVFFHLYSQGVVDNQTSLAALMGNNETYLSQVVSGIKPLSKKLINKICDLSDNINPDYLLGLSEELLKVREIQGTGYTGKEGEGINFVNEVEKERELLEIGIEQDKNQIEDKIYSVPLLPISAQAGSLNDFIVKVKESDCERIISPIRGADFAMSVAGDSMSPEYPNGSQILIKKINEKTFIEWGKVYVLDTTNGTVIKIVNRSEKEGYIRCTSINVDQRRYEPFDIPLTEVLGMYRVMMCMAIK